MRRRDAQVEECGACGAPVGSRCDTACPRREAVFTAMWNAASQETYAALANERWGGPAEVQR